jgi:NADPH2:quinone reductase
MRFGDTPAPQAGDGQVLIRVAATSVNRPDVLQRQGHYPPPPGESPILGLEAAGTVETLGPGVDGIAVGDRVAALLGGGGYAELAVAHAGCVLRIPPAVGFEAAACLCESYITAFMNVFTGAGLADGETLLVHGGSGGVGTAAIQLARVLTPRAKIISTASAAKCARVAALGADRVVDYRSEDFVAAVGEETDGPGADVILDHLGGAYFERNQRALATGGRLALIGVMQGRTAEIDLGRLLVKRQRIIGSTLRPRPLAEKAEIVAAFARSVLPAIADGRITPVVDRVYALADAALAHRDMESGTHFGKLVLRT